MKILHTSDLHLDSALSAHLSSGARELRKNELLYSFERLVIKARELGCEAFIIAGDLFDTQRITRRAKEAVCAVISAAEDITFLYLPGNHEKDAFLGAHLPNNFKVFGEDWTYFTIGGVRFSGRSECAGGMFDTFKTDKALANICVLHGELARHSGKGVIGTEDIAGRGIDHIALGHYHTYKSTLIGSCCAVYSGTPEGRGFDEVGRMGFSLIEVNGKRIESRFVPFSKRQLWDIEIRIDGVGTTAEVAFLVDQALKDIGREDLVRARLVGRCDPLLVKNTEGLKMRYSERFFYFEIRDESRAKIRIEDYKYDKSLKGEFIRLVLSDTSLTEREQDRIITAGLAALLGECAEGL